MSCKCIEFIEPKLDHMLIDTAHMANHKKTPHNKSTKQFKEKQKLATVTKKSHGTTNFGMDSRLWKNKPSL